MTKKAPYTIFGETRNVPVVVLYNGKEVSSDFWTAEVWIERGEDWYSVRPNTYTRIIERDRWLSAEKQN